MFTKIFPVVLCGGSGTRLWPLSRSTLPKQFITLGKQTLFEDVIDRVNVFSDKCYVVCGDEHRFLVASMIMNKGHDVENYSIMLEPMPRNTALAIALPAFDALERDKDSILLVLPSDQAIEPVDTLVENIKQTTEYTSDYIVTFGIKPDVPHTGYGYIENGEKIKDNLFKVKCFTEKPTLENAKKLLENNASWNSGMFFMKSKLFLDELKKYRPDIYNAAYEVYKSRTSDLDFTRFDEKLFAKVPAESIDYAVMEHTDKALVCPLTINWSDLGSFEALYDRSHRDDNNNACIGDTIMHNTKNSYVNASSSLVAVYGMDNVAVVQTKDAVLVTPLEKTQELKSLIAVLQEQQRNELDVHSIHHRPWGHYESLINSDGFQVKHIIVKPKGVLSMQMHHHRSEHWIVVKGTAFIKCGDIEKLVSENESFYIPLGAKHRLSNPGRIPLELIEVQTGSYLGEDDITRFEDKYNR